MYGQRPTKKMTKRLSRGPMTLQDSNVVEVPIKKNSLELEDDYFQLFDAATDEFFDISEGYMTRQTIPAVKNGKKFQVLWRVHIHLGVETVEFERSIYSFLDALGDWGGL